MSEYLEIPMGKGQGTLAASYCQPEGDIVESRAKTLAIMTHDFPGSHSHGQNDFFGDIEYLLSHLGFHTLRFDFRGCGNSHGREEDFTLAAAGEDFRTMLAWADERKFENFVYIGEGIGAAVCFQNMRPTVKTGLYFWPALDLPMLAHRRFAAKNSDGMDPEGFILVENTKIGVPFIKELLKADLSGAISKSQAPMLVQHGVQDDKIPIDHMDYLKTHSRVRRLDMTSYQDGTHGLPADKHRKMIFFHIGQFLEKYA